MTKQRKKIEDDIQKLMDAEYFVKQLDKLNPALEIAFSGGNFINQTIKQ